MTVAPATTNTWFLIVMGREQGPFTTDDMRNLVADGSITAETLVRRGDLSAPVRAVQIRGLLPAAAPAQPAPAVTPAPASASRRAASVSPTARTSAPTAPVRSGSSRIVRADPPPIEEAEVEAEEDGHLPDGRATPSQRLRSLGVDLLLIGGIALGMIVYAWGMADRAVEKRTAAVDAVRQTQSEAQVANRGEARPSLAGWPALQADLATRIAAKRQLVDAANAALPSIPKGSTPTHEQALLQAAAVNLANELEFLVKFHEFESNAYARDTAQIATIREATARSANFIIGFGVLLLLVVAPICELLTGGTPGKLLTGLRAVGPGRKSIGFVAACIRHAARFIPGVHAPLFTAADGLALHDRWSRSEVVLKGAVQRGGRKVASARTGQTVRTSRPR